VDQFERRMLAGIKAWLMNAELLAEFVRKNQGFPLYPLRADMLSVCTNIRKVPGADIAVVTQPRSPMVRDEVEVRLSPPEVGVLCSELLDC
jgi:hypothetical protein